MEYDASTRSTLPSSRNGSRLSEMVSIHLTSRVLGSMPRLGDEDLGHLDVEAGGDVGGRVLEAEAGLVVLHADLDRAGVGQLLHAGAVLELRGGVLLHLDVGALGVVAGVAAGGQAAVPGRCRPLRPWSG